jgi:hypothetical protein
MKTLPLADLAERHPGLTKALGESYAEAAGVCFSRHHRSPAVLSIDSHESQSECSAEWREPDERTLRAWANEIDATEAGAYGVSLAAIEMTEGYVAVSRAQTLTGADYYLAPADSALDDLEACLRLEISGSDAGNQAAIRQRLKSKIRQAAKGSSNLPAIASVVGFQERTVAIATVDGNHDVG